MKKLLIVLMVISMASFLFTGCIPTTPAEVAVTGVTLDQATMTLTAGGATGTLVATVAPATATNKSVTWSSSTLAVATVANGVVTPLTTGTTTITVTTVDGSKTATCAVTVSAAVATAAEAVIAVRDAAIVLDLAVLTTAGDISAFLDALADTNFTDYVTANDDAYVVAALAGNFSAVTTVALVDTAIAAVNTAEAAIVTAAAVAAVNAATTAAALNAALANAAFTGYVVANYDAYFVADFSVILTPTVAAINGVIAVAAVNEAVNVALPTSAALNAALADAAFTGYDAANYDAYLVFIGLFGGAQTTVAQVNAAIVETNAVAPVNAATTAVALNAALNNVLFPAYIAANAAEYFVASDVADILTTVYATAAAVDADIVLVNAAKIAIPTILWATTGDNDGAATFNETLTLTFSQSMVPLAITAANIDTILVAQNAALATLTHGTVFAPVWTVNNTKLTITYLGTVAATFTAGAGTDRITPVGFTSLLGGLVPVDGGTAPTAIPYVVLAGDF